MGKTIRDFENSGNVFLMERKLGSEGDYVKSPTRIGIGKHLSVKN